MRVVKLAGLVVVLSSLTTSAYAYIDPGMGSMWIQGILAIIAGCGVTLKMYWHRFKQLFRRQKTEAVNVSTNPENSINND